MYYFQAISVFLPYLKHVFIFFVCFLVLTSFTWAHNINFAMEAAPTQNVVWFYLKLGVQHIVPFGLDHILFIICLCLLSSEIKAILWQATAFTLAHSVTLALSMKGIVTLPSAIVEPIIALSIVFVAIENIILNELKPWRVAIVFLFGLIHGLGFASVLNEIGLPRNKFLTSILGFNLGVELGQVLVIMMIFLLVIVPFSKRPGYKKMIVFPVSVLIALIALYWTVQRIVG